ncbi:MAG: UvrD-helicase domain-containing protein [Prevotella sp.]|nr:UvrD-helicase domain-containing protein [Prevotella sp.]
MNILDELNDSQRAAVEYVDGPQLVIAGAGSGKTRVLTYKIAYLLLRGMKPWNILALTFTNKAANEMKTRIGKLVGMETARNLNMGTFHSVFSRILRREAEHIGFNSNFTIYDESDSRSLIKSIIKELQLDDKIYKPATVHSRISMAKNHLILPAEYARDRHALQRDSEARMPKLYALYATYCERLRKANAMDFDDLLVYTFMLFRDQPDICRKYSDRFQYVLVDEYQDTNSVQQRIVLQLTKEHQHVCVVGDDAQSIYGFRGANIDNILDFQQLYDNTKLFKLEQNYRSTQRIVQAANSLIRKNERQIPKDIYSRNAEGEKIILKHAYSDKEEAMIVCNDIKKIRKRDGCEYSDFAILYRTNAQSRSFEETFRKQNIPYRIYGGLSFYQRKEIKDVIAYFRLVANPDDEEAFKRIVNYPARGIGDTTVGKVIDAAGRAGVSLWTVAANPLQYGLNINKGTSNKLTAFRMLISSFIDRFVTDDAYTLGRDIIKQSGISADLYSDTSPESVARQENLEEFLNGMQDFVESRREEGRENEISISDFLQEVSLLTDLDSDNGDDTNRVSLMTIHSAKGLEFPTVFIVGLEENIFPSPMSAGSKRELEEERRLLYVAITRAERHCIMTCAKNRFRFGKMEFDTPSRFINDIDPALLLVESETDIDDRSGRYFGRESAGRLGQYAFDDEQPFGSPSRYSGGSNRYQNSRPVASQFRADPKPRVVHHQEETPVDPFSERFKQQLQQHGGHLKRVSQVVPDARRVTNPPQATSASPVNPSASTALHEGNVIEHERFGIGTVIRVEGTGENTKATVEFRNTGTKQLLLKFARFKVIS